MEVSQNDKYQEAIVVNWLRRCTEDTSVKDRCGSCPFDDGIHNCMDHLHSTAADLLVKLTGIQDRQPGKSVPLTDAQRFQFAAQSMGVLGGRI